MSSKKIKQKLETKQQVSKKISGRKRKRPDKTEEDAAPKSKKLKTEQTDASSRTQHQTKETTNQRRLSFSENWKKLQKMLRKSQKVKNPSKKISVNSKMETTSKKSRNTFDNQKTKHQNVRKKVIRRKRRTPLKKLPPPTSQNYELTKVVALDCEMVGVGIRGQESALARVAIVNSYGNVIYDRYVLTNPKDKIVDYRTKWSGIRPEDLKPGKALPFKTVQKEVAEILKGRIVVGHALENDFKALMLSHPFLMTRDTAKYRPLQRRRAHPYSLRYLAKKLLGVNIQTGEHNPAEDARAALLIYKLLRKDWERYIRRKLKSKWRRSSSKKKKRSTENNDNSTTKSEESEERTSLRRFNRK